MPKNSIYFVTGNQNKLLEVKKILGTDFPYKIESIDHDVPEYQGDEYFIVKKKCEFAFKYLNKPVIVEDTSLMCESLNGLPGPYVKWFLDKLGPDGLYKLLEGWENKKAKIVCLVGCILDDKTKFHYFEGVIEGELVAPKGNHGFGFDSCFKPNDYDKTLAELGPQIKDEISHRALAFEKFGKFIKSL